MDQNISNNKLENILLKIEYKLQRPGAHNETILFVFIFVFFKDWVYWKQIWSFIRDSSVELNNYEFRVSYGLLLLSV